MIIKAKNIIEYLDDHGEVYDIFGTPADAYTVASIFEPVPKGFYFFVGEELPDEIQDSLVLAGSSAVKASGNTVIAVENDPQLLFYKILNSFFSRTSDGVVAESAVVHPEAVIGDNVQIEDFCTIGRCEIGENCIIGSHSRIYDGTVIAENCVIDSHSVIGTQGIAWIWNEDATARIMLPQLGGVLIENDCFLGAHTVVVRGSLNENTSVGEHSVLAPGCRIGHGTNIGSYVHFANNVTTGGNTKIGNFSFIGSGAVFRPHVDIASETIVGAGAVVVKDTSATGMTLIGVPAEEFETKKAPSGMPKPKINYQT